MTFMLPWAMSMFLLLGDDAYTPNFEYGVCKTPVSLSIPCHHTLVVVPSHAGLAVPRDGWRQRLC